MITQELYQLAREQETKGCYPSALLFYLSAFTSCCNHGWNYPSGITEKISRLKSKLAISNNELLSMVLSYGPVSTEDCRLLLMYSLEGNIIEIKKTLQKV